MSALNFVLWGSTITATGTRTRIYCKDGQGHNFLMAAGEFVYIYGTTNYNGRHQILVTGYDGDDNAFFQIDTGTYYNETFTGSSKGIVNNESTSYYIVKRGSTIVYYLFDPLGEFNFYEDVSQLADGYYDYTLTPVGSNGVQGAAGEPLRLKVTSGVLSFVPSADPTGLTVSPAAAGKFKLSWLYPITTGMNLPDKFNVYWLTYDQPMNWTKDGEIAFVVGQAPVYTSVNSWNNGTVVHFKVQAVKGSEEKTNSVAVHATADTVGPVVSDPEIVVEVV